MQANDENLNKIMNIIRIISLIFIFIHCYWFCYSAFNQWGITTQAVDKIFINYQNEYGLFRYNISTKIIALFILIIASLGRERKDTKTSWGKILKFGIAGLLLYFGNFIFLELSISATSIAILYITTLTGGFLLLLSSFTFLARMLKKDIMKDVFNLQGESFLQTEELIINPESINLPTKYYYKGEFRKGWINVINPFRGTMVLGTPGSGKSFAVINQYIMQQIEKGYAMYVYDFKFPDLSKIVYNHLNSHLEGYEIKPKFYILNFDDLRKSNRCNPIAPETMTDVSDAYESAYIIMLNLNKSWIQKQGDFFVESPIILLAAIIWYLKIYKNGRYCTFPHAIEFLNKKYSDIFTILTSYPELENYLSPFMDAWEGGAQDQLQGQIASAKIPLSRMISPQLYWVMTGNDFTLDINNPIEPKILCIGNNPDRQNINSAALGLYNSRIVKMLNKPNKLKSSVIIDELPTMYFRGLDNLISTARSNRVAVTVGYQDNSQIIRDYGEKDARPIINTIGNVFSGLVKGQTAKELSESFGKIKQEKESLSINKNDTSTSLSTQMDSLIPASKIASLSQGTFVGQLTDNFEQKLEQKFFHAEIVIDLQKIKEETKIYKPLPMITDFVDPETGKDMYKDIIDANYYRVKNDIEEIVTDELYRIQEDPDLCHLIKN